VYDRFVRKTGLVVTWLLLAVAFASFVTASLWSPSPAPARAVPRRSPVDAFIPRHGGEPARLEGDFLSIDASFDRHTARINAIAFDEEGRSFATAGSDGLVHTWDARTGAQRLTLRGHERGVQCVAFGGGWIATGGWDGTARVWLAETGAEVGRVRVGSAGATSVAIAGRRLIVGDGDGAVGCWDWVSGRRLEGTAIPDGPVTCLAVSPDDTTVAAGFGQGAIRRWQVDEWRELPVVRGHVKAVGAMVYTPDGRSLVSASRDGVVHVTDLRTHSTTRSRSFPGGVYALSREGGSLACVSGDRELQVLAVLGRVEGRAAGAAMAPVTCVAVSEEGRTVAMGCGDASVRLFRRK
jgi:WD40 repeat protein